MEISFWVGKMGAWTKGRGLHDLLDRVTLPLTGHRKSAKQVRISRPADMPSSTVFLAHSRESSVPYRWEDRGHLSPEHKLNRLRLRRR